MAAELGFGARIRLEPLSEKTQIRQEYESVLLPLQRQSRAAGVEAHIRLLQDEDLGARLRALAAELPAAGLVLSHPPKLDGILHAVTAEVLVDARCPLYLVGMDRPEDPSRGSALHRMLWRLRPWAATA